MYSVMATRSKPMQDRAVAQFLNSVPCAQRRSALTDASRAASVLAGERIFLAVPSRDIQKARALGAKWDRDHLGSWTTQRYALQASTVMTCWPSLPKR
jgi:putative DNA primase/helicase